MKKNFLFFAITIFFTQIAVSQNSFEERFFNDKKNKINYLLYIPENSEENMPLIIYLHSKSAKGNDLNKITENEIFPQYLKNGEFGNLKAFVIMPQIPESFKNWHIINGSLKNLIISVVNEFKIDKENISLTGHSMGGAGTWNLAADYPDLFSKIAPLSGNSQDAFFTATKLKNVEVWAFAGSSDEIIKSEGSEKTVEYLRESGNNAKITIFENASHTEVPALAYLDKQINLIGWLTQKK